MSTPETPRDLMAALQASLAACPLPKGSAMPETPRTWTLMAGYEGANHKWFVMGASAKAEPCENVEVVEKAPVDAERERLRRRTHEIAEAKDAEHAAVKRELGRLKLAVDQARERTKDWKPDWTDDPPSREPYGWWRYTSHNHAMEAVALVAERNEAVAERERLLDLIEDLLITIKTSTVHGSLEFYDRAKGLLREYGRLGDTTAEALNRRYGLPKEESGA